MLVYPALHHTQAAGDGVPAEESRGKGERLAGAPGSQTLRNRFFILPDDSSKALE